MSYTMPAHVKRLHRSGFDARPHRTPETRAAALAWAAQPTPPAAWERAALWAPMPACLRRLHREKFDARPHRLAVPAAVPLAPSPAVTRPAKGPAPKRDFLAFLDTLPRRRAA